MKLTENDDIVVVPLSWLTRELRKEFIQMGYEVIPISGYYETGGYRAFKIIGKYTVDIRWIYYYSIPIWEDWKLTAKYANDIDKYHSTNGQQMFDHLDDDEKIQALTYGWYNNDYIVKYFQKHPDLLKRAKKSLRSDNAYFYFEKLLYRSNL